MKKQEQKIFLDYPLKQLSPCQIDSGTELQKLSVEWLNNEWLKVYILNV
jgi:hypothetical protein